MNTPTNITSAEPIIFNRTIWYPVTDGHAVGFRIENRNPDDPQPPEYIMLNPSESDEGPDCAFLYQGDTGDACQDPAHHYYALERL